MFYPHGRCIAAWLSEEAVRGIVTPSRARNPHTTTTNNNDVLEADMDRMGDATKQILSTNLNAFPGAILCGSALHKHSTSAT
jgi:hypothetical protein